MLSFLNKNVIVFGDTLTMCCKCTDTADGLCKIRAARVLGLGFRWK